MKRKPIAPRCAKALSAEAGRIGTMKAKVAKADINRNPRLAAKVERALVRAGESARRTARMHGTPIYVWENGKVVAKKP
jgi:hypothetical protein